MERNKKNLLHWSYLVGIVLKGLDGMIELVGGAVLFVTGLAQIIRMVAAWARSALPMGNDFVANHLSHMAENLAPGAQHFASTYLLIHGLIKVGLVAALLRGWRHAYPIALLVLTAFIGYQCFRLYRYHSLFLAAFTVIDVVIVLLIWLEWRRVRNTRR